MSRQQEADANGGAFDYRGVLFLLLVSVVALGFLNSPGTVDVDSFIGWTNEVLVRGPFDGYHAISLDYPPLTSALLYGLGKASSLLGLELRLAFKLSLFGFLLVSTFIFWRWTKNLVWAAFFELSLILNCVALGYTDITYTPTLLLSLWALQKRKWAWFTLLYGVSCLIKWQPIIIAPFLLVFILNIQSWRQWRQIDLKRIAGRVVGPALAVIVLLVILYGWEIFRAFGRASSDELLSGNALNFNWILTHYLRQFHGWYGGLDNGLATWVVTRDLRVTALPKLLFVASYLGALYLLWRGPKRFDRLVRYTLLGFLSYFMFNTGVHENHLFIAGVLAAVLYALDQRHLLTYAFWAVAANINLYFFYGTAGTSLPFNRVVFIDIALPLSFLYLIFFLAEYTAAWLEVRGEPENPAYRVTGDAVETPPPGPGPAG